MSKPDSHPGRFAWRELMTHDRVASRDYYTRLFGWTTREMDMGPGAPYVIFRAGDEDVGGMMEFDPSQGIRVMWMPYVAVEDVDAATSRVGDQGGCVHVEPRNIPGVGRFSVIADPIGALVAAIMLPGGIPPEPVHRPRPGEFCFEQLLSPDPGAVVPFYESVFSWTHAKYDMGPAGSYWMFKRGDRDAAGAMPIPPGSEGRPQWLCYVEVEDVDAMAVRVTELGGKIFLPPSDIPGVGRLAVTADPQGAQLALFKSVSA